MLFVTLFCNCSCVPGDLSSCTEIGTTQLKRIHTLKVTSKGYIANL